MGHRYTLMLQINAEYFFCYLCIFLICENLFNLRDLCAII